MPAFSKPYRNLETTKSVNKHKLLQEIAARTQIKDSVVEEVLTTFREIATEEIVNKGKFNFFGLFSVDNFQTKEARTGFGFVPARKRLRTKLSDRVKKLWNGKLREGNENYLSYEELVDLYSDSGESSSRRDLEKSLGISVSPVQEQKITGNPLLDEDDEEY